MAAPSLDLTALRTEVNLEKALNETGIAAREPLVSLEAGARASEDGLSLSGDGAGIALVVGAEVCSLFFLTITSFLKKLGKGWRVLEIGEVEACGEIGETQVLCLIDRS